MPDNKEALIRYRLINKCLLDRTYITRGSSGKPVKRNWTSARLVREQLMVTAMPCETMTGLVTMHQYSWTEAGVFIILRTNQP